MIPNHQEVESLDLTPRVIHFTEGDMKTAFSITKC